MAKIEGPLFSYVASGSIQNRLTFSRRNSGQQVRYQKAQEDVITSARTIQRDYFQEAATQWMTLSNAEKQQWNDFIK